MFELGNPIHVFDYDKLTNGKLTLTLSKGEEKFVSVDNKAYSLPKDAIIFKSGNEVVDLCGIKGGLNSGISNSTKNVLILVAIYDGVYIRKVCQKLKLFSEASHIFERGANAGGTIDALKRVVSLTQKLAGGAVASDLIDKKEFKFEPWKLTLSLNKLEKVLGVTLPTKTVLNLLSRLNLNPVQKKESIICTIPTYRGDLKIEEDLIEEVARLYGYNNFPLTLPEAKLPVKKMPYFYDWKWEIKLKNLMKAAGYTEALTLSLISEDLINSVNLEQATHIRLANPVSRDYEFMRTSLLPSLLEGVKLNSKEQRIKLFEFNKVYLGSLGKTKEPQMLSGVEVGGNYETLKGMIDLLCERLNFQNISIENVEGKNFWHPAKTAILKYKELIVGTFGALSPQVLENLGIKQSVYAFELDSEKLKQASQSIVFKPLPKYPPQIEDITFILPEETYVLDINHEIAKSNPLISSVSYSEKFKNAYTFRIEYKHPDRTLTDSEVEEARKAAIKAIEKKFNGKVK